MTRFSELPISAYMQARLAAAQFSVPTPVQEATIPVALEGKDIFATAQTGTGKTLAFLVPVLQQMLEKPAAGIGVLVVVPTRELAMQVTEQYEALRGKSLPPAALVIGGTGERSQLSDLRRARLVVSTPGRLEDFLDRGLIQLRGVHTLVLDEADRMFDMGFLPAVKRIAAALPKSRQTLCFSATLMPSVVDVVRQYMKAPVRIAIGSASKPCTNVKVQAIEVCRENKHEVLEQLLNNEDGRCLVFARTKRGTERLAKRLSRGGHSAASIHGDRSQSQRTAALHGFQEGRYHVLVATDVASRGIHVEDIAHVINYDLPQIAEDFIHRVGRTGRAGERGLASTLFEGHEASELRELEKTLGISIERTSVARGTESRRASESRRETASTPIVITEPSRPSRSSLTALPGEFLQNAR